MDKVPLWHIPFQRYNIAFRSDSDVTDGMKMLRSKILEKLSGFQALKCGFSLKDYYEYQPFDYIFVGFKTIGPLNIPKTRQTNGLYESLNEAWFTFYESSGLKIRLQYFIQLTHGSLIEGISWIKADRTGPFRNSDFNKLRNCFETKTALQSRRTYIKPSYGIYDGKRHLIGKMFNYEVMPDRQGLEMSEDVAEIMASRVSEVYECLIAEDSRILIYNALKNINKSIN